jgi:hypothetical protein
MYLLDNMEVAILEKESYSYKYIHASTRMMGHKNDCFDEAVNIINYWLLGFLLSQTTAGPSSR